MNTKYTPPVQSRQASVIPYTNPLQRNGCVAHETCATICKPLQKKTSFFSINDNKDSLEMQIYTNQRRTMEAFYELENLIPNGVPSRASIIEMRSISQEQDDNNVEKTSETRSVLIQNRNDS